jgi:hypothetical protein
VAQAEAVDYRIGVGQRAEQQSEEWVDNQKTQDRQQQGNPRAGHDAPTNALNAAAPDLDAPARLSVQSAFPLAGALGLFNILLLWPPWIASLGDRARAGKVAESRASESEPPRSKSIIPRRKTQNLDLNCSNFRSSIRSKFNR